MNGAEAKPAHAMPWWCSPAGLGLGFQIPVLLLVAWAGSAADDSSVLTIRALRFLHGPYLLLALAMMLVLVLAGAIGSQLRFSARPHDAGQGWNTAAAALGTLALLAYLVWFRDYLLNPALLFGVLTGASTPSRSDIALTPGLTSLVNVAPVFFSIHAYRFIVARQPLPRALHVLALVLAAMTLFRVYAWSERLAMIENAVPPALALAVAAARGSGRAARLLRAAGPYAALPLVVVFFGFAESSRSWASDTYHGKHDFWAFMAGRLATYYYTSLNNGAGMLATADWPSYRFEFVGSWLHNLPGIGHRFSALVGANDQVLTEFFARFGDPEFNNPSGLFAVVVDLGLVFGLLYMAVFGLAAGLMHRAYRDGQLVGVLLYPPLFIAALEIFRYPYFGESRAVTWVVGALLALLVARLHAAVTDPEPGAKP